MSALRRLSASLPAGGLPYRDFSDPRNRPRNGWRKVRREILMQLGAT